ncbi:hypothetical protein PoB_005058200 [Plakobranchus ocellatus]|uniref:Uncharacterized protein n=1 Tax=Plakobranchus ocellatus TaxID=259542 RepID=A0AAV4BYF7_9GAST|nr:hypothetical protein PoB_005058200 [Plakobranchus ocellatus]
MGQDTLWLPSSVENVNFIWLKILKRSVHITAAKKCPRGGQYCNRKCHRQMCKERTRDFQGPFCREFEPQHWRSSLTEGLKV